MQIYRVGQESIVTLPWYTFNVEVLRNTHGDALGFYGLAETESALPVGFEIAGKTARHELPCELFNHELKDIDLKSPEALAEFMSEFGLVFSNEESMEKHRSLYEKGGDLIETWETLCSMTSSIRQKGYAFLRSHTLRLKVNLDHLENLYLNGETLEVDKRWLSTAQAKVEMLYFETDFGRSLPPDPSFKIQYPAGYFNPGQLAYLVSIEEVQRILYRFQECVEVAKVLHQTKELEVVSTMLKRDKAETLEYIKELDIFLANYLRNLTPNIGFICKSGPEEGKPVLPGKIFEASFSNALALQIQDFNLNDSHYKHCKECKVLFFDRRTEGRKNKPHSDAKFCCEPCRRRFAQREHRKTAGYRQKQDKKRKEAQ
ncbi:MAG: hypothetical protein LBJ48_03100 [Coriobacteriales bacterium]|jgi:hypothetical protein|nr:hypothetical protein [Coriobacteriales bacterium]